MVDSRQKGKTFEYQVRDKLSEALGFKFERVPLSGSLPYLKGDIFIPHGDFPYVIECKHYKEIEWNNLLTAKTSTILEFWTQTTREAGQVNKKPLLIYKWNFSKLYACWNDDVLTQNYVKVKTGDHEFTMALFDDWVSAVKPILSKK